MQVPLFPLHTVLAPGIALPLHIFEERYRAMVRRCLDTSTPFGVVLIREGSEVAPRDGESAELAIAGVGTLAEIREASKYADGRWDLLCVGTARFAILEVHSDVEPYLLADVDVFPDEPMAAAALEDLTGRVTRRFVDYLRLLQPRDGESVEPIDVQMEVDVEVDDVDAAGDDDRVDDADAGDDEDLAGELEVPGVRSLRVSEPVPIPVDDPAAARAVLRIPDDPTALSFLLTGILQVEPDRKQALLEAAGAEDRLRDIDELLDRELDLLRRRLAPYAVDRRSIAGSDN